MARDSEILPLKTPPKNADQKGLPSQGQKTAACMHCGKPTLAGSRLAVCAACADPFTIRETRLCAELELSKDRLRERRAYYLQEGKHWAIVDKRVQYSQVGAEILRSTRAAVLPARGNKNAATGDAAPVRRPIALLLEKNPPPPAPLKFEGKLIAWAAPPRNRKVVICYFPGADPYNPMELVSLRVRDNQNFLRGMRIPDDKPPGSKVRVNAVKDSQDVFELMGPTPRWRGRW
jgi:hypothetical protein